jgi:diguanylate cyclase (GGDEF)-like protein/hemerythrin-like metal-binding protein/PAS domain S-box-containing protein
MTPTTRKISGRTDKGQTVFNFTTEETFRAAFELAGVGMGLVDEHGRFFEVNIKLCEFFKIPREEMIGMTLSDLPVAKGESPALDPNTAAQLSGSPDALFERRFALAHGNQVWAEVSYGPVWGPDDKPEFFIATFHNITERKLLQSSLEKQALLDPLTLALNRLSFDQRANSELLRSGRHGYSLSLIMADLDFFKIVNDTYGHGAGDQVLGTFGRIVRECLRSMDLFGRWGGEEFLILLPDTGPSGAKRVSERIRISLEEHKFQTGAHATVSLGIVARRSGEGFSSLLERADAAMYQAKENGRNQVFVDPNDQGNEYARKPDRLGNLELHWRKAYCCGVPEIDAEHQHKFDIANRILFALNFDPDSPEIAVLVDELLAHITEHFEHEDRMLEARGFPGAAEHAETHRRLITQANELATRYKNKETTAGALIGFVIQDVVATHILHEDRKYFAWVKKPAAPVVRRRRIWTLDDPR